MVDIINETFKFFNNSPKRQRFFLNIFWMLLNQIAPKASYLDFVGLAGWNGIHVVRHFMNCMCIFAAA